MKNIVILISGRGSNMQAIVKACQQEQWPARIAAVISNKADAGGLAFAEEHQIPAIVVPSKGAASREAYDAELQRQMLFHRIWWCWPVLRILTPAFTAHYENRMLNIHPSLLPSFVGLHHSRRWMQA
jgi:phosphoribosylglycinamide formyltransferase-1